MSLPDFFLLVLILVVARALIFFSSGLFPSFGVKPIARGAFGEKRTWREFLLFPVFTGLLGFFFFGPIAGCFGVAWEVGLLLNSFIKRRLGVPAGGHAHGIASLIQYLTDIGVPVLAVAGFLCVLYSLSFSAIIPFVVVFFLMMFVIDIVRYTHFQKLDFPNPLVIFFQIFVWIFFRPIHYFYGNCGTMKIDHQNKKNIFIANHISMLDPFLICTSVDISSTCYLIPYRFMVSNHYIDKSLTHICLLLVGGYPATIRDSDGKNQTLQLSADFLERGETVVIFPEGGIKKKQLKVGAFYLNRNVENSLLQLFRIQKIKKRFQIWNLGNHSIGGEAHNEDLLPTGESIFSRIDT